MLAAFDPSPQAYPSLSRGPSLTQRVDEITLPTWTAMWLTHMN